MINMTEITALFLGTIVPECPTINVTVFRVNATTQADDTIGTFSVVLIPSSNITGSFRQQSRYDSASEVEGLVYLYGDKTTHKALRINDWFFVAGVDATQKYRYEITDILDYPQSPLWEARARIKK